MGACASVECPRCHKEFIVTPIMLGAGHKFHCPFCDAYFPENESPRIWRPDGSWASGLAGEAGKRI
jgi:hypothetical protein